MGPLVSILSWLFFETIDGIIAVAILLYVALWKVRKRFPKAPEPIYIVAPAILVALLVVPSIPRYLFEQETLEKIEGKAWIRVVEKMRWGSASEPLTWVMTPIGSVTIIMPDPPVEGAFRQEIMRYGKEPVVATVKADCNRSRIIYARPDKAGVFRDTTPSPLKMNSLQKRRFCDYDWTREKEAFRIEYLRQVVK
jgi:hypothetical protein